MDKTSQTDKITLEAISSSLSQCPFEFSDNPDLTQAAVAMMLRGEPPFEIFFIVRAHHSGDPWSGDIGFPGGKRETGESATDAALRETREEVSIDLSTERLLGHLSPIVGAHLPIEIACLVYHVSADQVADRNHEVSQAFWYDTRNLLQPDRFGDYPVTFGEEPLSRPGVRIFPDGGPILWGITYRLLEQFFTGVGLSFPPESNI
jgi:8-oxo-dGTP pyrophosphatase MutT (NUDIX family)